MNRETTKTIFDAHPRDVQDVAESFRRMGMTKGDAAVLLRLAEMIHSGRISPEHDLAGVVALPNWARLSGRGNLTIDLDQVETFTVTAPNGTRRMLVGARAGVQIAVDGEQFDVTRRELAGGDDGLITPKPTGAL